MNIINDDAQWVLKNIDSCQTEFQLQAADKMIDLFQKRYEKDQRCESHIDQLTTFLQVRHASLYAGAQ